MNERIQELIRQSTRIVDGGPDMFSMPREFFDKELFAELIVRECAEICLEANDHKNILRYFGVEE